MKNRMENGNNRNFRFTVYCHGSAVKLTLKPGQIINHFHGKRTEEGYCYYGTIMQHVGHGVRRQITTWSRDCDGSWESCDDDYCSAKNLSAEENYYGEKIPRWEDLETTIYDEYAVAAGY